MFVPSKTITNQNYICFNSYRAVNTFRHGSRKQSVNILYGNNRWVFLKSVQSTLNALCGQKVLFLNVKQSIYKEPT